MRKVKFTEEEAMLVFTALLRYREKLKDEGKNELAHKVNIAALKL